MKKENTAKSIFLINSMEMGGAERVLSEIVPVLEKKNKVKLLTFKDSNFYSKKISCEFLVKTNSDLVMMLLTPYYMYKIHKMSKTAKIISFLEFSNFINILTNKNAIISARTSMNSFVGLKGKIYKFFIKKLYPKAKLIIVNSEENKIYLTKYLNLNPNKIIVIYNPVPELENNENKSKKNNKKKDIK